MQIVRPKMTKATYQALKKYIMKEREKKKQEQEQDKEQERLKKERELKKKKEEEDSLTLEQTKEQIALWENKLAALKKEKHELFSQLKKVLHQENALKQKTQLKEQQSEQTSLQHQYMVSINNPQAFLQQQSNKKYLSIPVQQNPRSLKRSRSPSPAPYPAHYASTLVQPNSAYTNIIKAEPPFCLKPGTYQPGQAPSGHPNFTGQPSAHSYMQQNPQQQPGGSFQPSPNQKYSLTPSPAFYPPPHFSHQSSKSSIPESQFPPGNYLRQSSSSQRRHQQPVPSVPTTAYAMNIPSQMDHSSNKVGFSSDDKLRLPQRSLVQTRSHGYSQQNRY